MCLIVFDWQPNTRTPLRLAANRDEFLDRPSAPLDHWSDAPDILGGRDLRAGGTWLAAHRRGRLAAVTNVRDPEFKAPINGPSRGALVRQALECDSLSDWLQALADGNAAHYAGFNLLATDSRILWHLHHGRDGTHLQQVSAGIHGLSNASLDTPWPKLVRSRKALESAVASSEDDFGTHAWKLLADPQRPDDTELPETGVELELERLLSSAFISGADYGTRASSWVEWRSNGTIIIGERSFGAHGHLFDERQCELTTSDISRALPDAD